MKFYSDSDQTVRVRWFFVDEETPFVPYPNSFCSANWDSDPKGAPGIGERVEYGRTWANGAAPADFPADHVCGTAEQWSGGQPSPPETPVDLNYQGVPMCCQNAGPMPELPAMPDGVVWWLRPETLLWQGAQLDQTVTCWADASPSKAPAIQWMDAQRPIFGQDAIGYHLRFDGDGRNMVRDPALSLGNAWTAFWAADRAVAVGVNWSALLLAAPNDKGYGQSDVRSSYFGSVSFAFWNNVLFPPQTKTPTRGWLKRTATQVKLGGNASISDPTKNVSSADTLTITGIGPMTMNDDLNSVSVREVIVFNRTLTDAEITQVYTYLTDRFNE